MQILWTIASILKLIQDATPFFGGALPFLGFLDPLNLLDGIGLLFPGIGK